MKKIHILHELPLSKGSRADYLTNNIILINKKAQETMPIKAATAVRVPVVGGHSEAVNIEFENDFDLTEIRQLLHQQAGIELKDDPTTYTYPMPIFAEGKDAVFVGRIRRDESQANTLNLWIVADNLRKGAATNAVQIAHLLLKNGLV
jgi:aspartate-semialdehyde dehydrogenase